MDTDSFALNIEGVRQLIGSRTNKVLTEPIGDEEGVSSVHIDVLDLPMDDAELLKLRDQWEFSYGQYMGDVNWRSDRNLNYYLGRQKQATLDSSKSVASNIIFEAQETFLPIALKNSPDPVVYSDDTDIGDLASKAVKSMLHYQSDCQNLRRKLAVMTRHWSIYFIGIMKHGWNEDSNDIESKVCNPRNFILDPSGYVDEFGDFKGQYVGEKIECTAQELIDRFPKEKVRDYVTVKTNGHLGTRVKYTEWWTNEYCFYTFENIVLDKNKNPYFNYSSDHKIGSYDGAPETKGTVQGHNHFARPKMPYTFLSVFSLQEHPHDITNLIEQNIPNQDRINEFESNIAKNVRTANNSLLVSERHGFNSEKAHEAAMAVENGDPVLIPASDSGDIRGAISRLEAPDIPSGVFNALENSKEDLRSVFGVAGTAATAEGAQDTTARGMILNQSHDISRIGGGIGDALEQVADNVFNWWLQIMYVFYDEPHYAAVLGQGRAIEYVQISKSDLNRHFVVTITPNSMRPKDDISEQNLAMEQAQSGWLDPINLFKKLNYSDPMQTAAQVTLWKIAPQMYYQQYFGQGTPGTTAGQPGVPGAPPADLNANGAPPVPGETPSSLSGGAASPELSQVPINSAALPQ